MCPRLERTGFCPAKNCSFAHSASEMKPLPNFQKTALCFNFKKGKCFDKNCRYAHGEEQLRVFHEDDEVDEVCQTTKAIPKAPVVCPMFLMDVCKQGRACKRGAHPRPATRDSMMAAFKL